MSNHFLELVQVIGLPSDCDVEEIDLNDDAVRERLPGSKWSPKMCSDADSDSAGGGGLRIEMAAGIGTGVESGTVESLEMLFVGERYPLKLLVRG